MKKYWKYLILLGIMIIAVGAVIGMNLYRRDSDGKTFKATVDREKVMMKPDWYAEVKLSANKGTKYQVKNAREKIVNHSKTTKNGKAIIKINKTGRFTVVAKSDNGHVTHKIPIKVINYKNNVNKTTTSLGPLSFKVSDVEYAKETKNSTNIDSIYKQLNKNYYQIKINYEVKNNGDKSINPQYTTWLPVDDLDREFPYFAEGTDTVADDSIIGTSTIQPHSSRAGIITMVSNNKFTVQHLKLDVEEVLGDNGKHIAKGGAVEFK